MALKLRHHDRKTHLRRVPRGEAARAIFEAVEQVRVEALGSDVRAVAAAVRQLLADSDEATIDTDVFVANAEKIGAFCGKNPTVSIVNAAEAVLGKNK